MNFSHAVAVVALALTIPFASAAGQTASEEPSKWSLSLGVDPTNLDLRTRDPGVSARVVGNLTREWRAPNSSFGRQLSLMVGGDAPIKGSPANSQDCSLSCWTSVSRKYASLTAGVSWDVVHVSRFTPYVRGATGLYYTKWSGNTATGSALAGQSMYSRSGFSLGANGGLGIKARLGSHEFFIEQALHAFDLRHFDKGVYPISFGIKF
jgi:hypothetical protein